jgi:hypothetical protein
MQRLKVIQDNIGGNYIWRNLRKPMIQQLIQPNGYGLNPRILSSRQQFIHSILTTLTLYEVDSYQR